MIGHPGSPDVLVVGAGIFGVTAALELRRRGARVALVDPGPLPHPLAASTDISKVVRLEYGADEDYTQLAEEARAGWMSWNREFRDTLYHEVGFAVLARSAMASGSFEGESFRTLTRRGHPLARLDEASIHQRFPAFRRGALSDGFFNSKGGYAESGRVVAALLDACRTSGVELRVGPRVDAVTVTGGVAVGVETSVGTMPAGQVVVAAGAWTPYLVPELQAVMRISGHPVFHLRPDNPASFRSPAFPVFTADIANCGWYGFPLHPSAGVVKIANHGVGLPLHPDRDPRVVGDDDVMRLRRFLADALPSLVAAPIVFTRRCLYCDTLDGHFWIDRHPEIARLTVAAGGSGHAFKFAPVLGQLIADALEARPRPLLAKFRWRQLRPNTAAEEAARHRSAPTESS